MTLSRPAYCCASSSVMSEETRVMRSEGRTSNGAGSTRTKSSCGKKYSESCRMCVPGAAPA
eukprot:35894-Eustigmatos_ZCMA.PRE.1